MNVTTSAALKLNSPNTLVVNKDFWEAFALSCCLKIRPRKDENLEHFLVRLEHIYYIQKLKKRYD